MKPSVGPAVGPGDGDDDVPGSAEQVKKERELLQKVVLDRFTATPKSVQTFGSVTLAWEVTLPNSPAIDISVSLNANINKQTVPPTGTVSRTLTQSTTFTLVAVTEHAGRTLRSLTVNVDRSACTSRLVADAFLMTSILKQAFNSRFSGSAKFSLRGDGTEVTLGNGTISIHVPLTINVPDWFDADMSIDIQLALSAGKPLRVGVVQTSVSVDWTFFENLLSLGCGGLVESGMEQIATEFMRNIAEVEVAPQVEKQLIDQVNNFLISLKDADPAHREFLPTALILNATGFSVTGCPKV